MSYAGKININGTPYPIASTLFGTCQTPEDVAQKVVGIAEFDTLIAGVMVAVFFEQSNTAVNPSLKVGTEEAAIIYTDGLRPVGDAPATSWPANSIVLFVYDGTSWKIINTTRALRDETQEALTANLSKATSNFAPAYDNEATYGTGDLCVHNDLLYRCTTAISEAEAWDAGHWALVDVAGVCTPRVGTISLPTASWTGEGPWTQTVTVTGTSVYEKSMVSLQPDATAFNQMAADGTAAIFVTNNNGTLTATAVQKMPTVDLTVQCTVTETA